MQAPRVPPWADAEPGESARERAHVEEDDAGELTPLVLALGILLLVGVILMALVGVNAIGGRGVASGSNLSQPTEWTDEPTKVTTGAPRSDITVAVSVASPRGDSNSGDTDSDLVVVDLARTNTESGEATDTSSPVDGVQTAQVQAPLVEEPEAEIDRAAEAVEVVDQSAASPVTTTTTGQRLQIIDQSDEALGATSPQAVSLSVTATTTEPQAEPNPPTTAAAPAVGSENDPLADAPTTTTTALVAPGLDLGGLAVDVGETTAILHWQIVGPTEEISGFEVRWSCCAEDALVQRVDASERRLQFFDLEPSTVYLMAVTALGPDGQLIERTTRTRTITTKRSGLGAPSAAYDVSAVAGPGPNQVTVKWSADDDEALGGFYISVGCCSGQLKDKSASIDDPSARVHVINRLERGETYAVDVVSKDVNFIGDERTAQRAYVLLGNE